MFTRARRLEGGKVDAIPIETLFLRIASLTGVFAKKDTSPIETYFGFVSRSFRTSGWDQDLEVHLAYLIGSGALGQMRSHPVWASLGGGAWTVRDGGGI